MWNILQLHIDKLAIIFSIGNQVGLTNLYLQLHKTGLKIDMSKKLSRIGPVSDKMITELFSYFF